MGNRKKSRIKETFEVDVHFIFPLIFCVFYIKTFSFNRHRNGSCVITHSDVPGCPLMCLNEKVSDPYSAVKTVSVLTDRETGSVQQREGV